MARSLSAIETLVRQLQGALGGKSSRSGVLTVTWPGGSSVSNWVSGPHGMPTTPTETLATLNNQAGTGFCMIEAAANATDVFVRLSTTGFTPSSSASNPVTWEVRG